MSRKWRNWYQNEVDEETKGADSRDKVKHNERYSPPVAFAIRLRSIFLHRRTAIVPLSTKYFRQRSSMPPVVRITLAPAVRIFWMRSLVMSASLQTNHSSMLHTACQSTYTIYMCTSYCRLLQRELTAV